MEFYEVLEKRRTYCDYANREELYPNSKRC